MPSPIRKDCKNCSKKISIGDKDYNDLRLSGFCYKCRVEDMKANIDDILKITNEEQYNQLMDWCDKYNIHWKYQKAKEKKYFGETFIHISPTEINIPFWTDEKGIIHYDMQKKSHKTFGFFRNKYIKPFNK